jgi:hypothetical protein
MLTPMNALQAAAHVTGAVEYLEITNSVWKPFDPNVPVAPNIIISWQFRLKKPRKSRIEQIIEHWPSLPIFQNLGVKNSELIDFGKRVVSVAANLVMSMAPGMRPIDAGNRLIQLMTDPETSAGTPDSPKDCCWAGELNCDGNHP